MGGNAILIIRLDRHLACKLVALNYHYLMRIYYALYVNDSLLGIVVVVEILIKIQKRITHFLQSNVNLWVGSVGSITIVIQCSKIPRYGHSGCPSKDNSHISLMRARETSMGKAPYLYILLATYALLSI